MADLNAIAEQLSGLTIMEAAELSKILEFVEQMNSVDTEDVEPLTHPQDRLLRMREDRVTESDQRDDFQRIAPAVEAGLYLVPRVIE